MAFLSDAGRDRLDATLVSEFFCVVRVSFWVFLVVIWCVLVCFVWVFFAFCANLCVG